MTEEMMQKLQTTQLRMMRMIIQTKRKTGEAHTAAHAASVDVTADVEPHDLDSEQGDDTTEHNKQDLNEHEESRDDVDSRVAPTTSQQRIQKTSLEPWVGRLASSKRNHVLDPQAAPTRGTERTGGRTRSRTRSRLDWGRQPAARCGPRGRSPSFSTA